MSLEKVEEIGGFSVAVKGGITVITSLRCNAFEEFIMVIDALVARYPYQKRLWDYRQGDFNMTSREIVKLTQYGASRFVGPTKSVSVTLPDQLLAFGIIREAIGLMPEISTEPMIFTDFDQAIAWLNNPLTSADVDSNFSVGPF